MKKLTKWSVRPRLWNLFLAAFVLFSPWQLQAQNLKEIKGTVVSGGDKTPLAGASVLIKGGKEGTVTDEAGKFTIRIPEQGSVVLEIKFLGFKTQEVRVKDQSDLIVNLGDDDSQALNQVVVVGYGTQRKSALATAVGSVEGKAIVERGTVNPMQAVQGQIAGVDISSTSGRAGAASYNVQIRGQNSLAGGQPLYVVDGVIVDNINFLNPQDISKMDVLKDAASTAIYGSRGSNGVILVTTKLASGAKGAPTISFDSYVGVRKVARMPDFMNGDEQVLLLRNSKITNAMIGGLPYDANTWARGNVELVRRGEEHDYTDWRSIVLRNGIQQNHWLTASGVSADNKIRYLIGAGYQDEKGNLIQEYINKYNFKASIDARINDQWSTGINLNFAHSKLEQGSDYAYHAAFRQTPIYHAYDIKDGSLAVVPSQIWDPVNLQYTGYGSFVNPILELANTQNTTKADMAMGNLYLQFSPVSWISFRSSLSPSMNFSKKGHFAGALSQEQLGYLPAASIANNQGFSYILDNMVVVNKSIKEHSFIFTGLYSLQNQELEDNSSAVMDLPFASGWYNMGSTSNRTDISSSYLQVSTISFMARLNYAYQNKYLVSLVNRWDGSSKLAEGHKWAAFPSAAVAWRLSEEDFLKNSGFISDLKLRFSAGVSGNNNNISAYETQNTLSTPAYYDFGGTPAFGYTPSRLANPLLTWERTREYNLGLDYALFNGRVSGTIDVYDKLSHGVLMDRNIPLESGWTSIKDNVGSVSNKGVELSLRTVNVATKDLTWTTTFTVGRNKNAIVELLGKKEDLPGNAWFIGQPVNVFYNYKLDGVWQEKDRAEALTYSQLPGQSRVKDINGDGKITSPEDMTIIGQQDPKWIGGFSTRVTYKNLDLSASLFAREGVTIFSNFNQNFLRYDGLTNYEFLNGQYYMPPNDVNTGMASNYYPQPNNSGPYWRRLMPIVPASFVKVQNIALGYTIPARAMEKVKIKSLRVYVNVLNPFVFTKYKGFDPETDGTGDINTTGVASVTYQFGLNLKF